MANLVSELRIALGDDQTPPQLLSTVHRRGHRLLAQADVAPPVAPVSPAVLPTPAAQPCLIGCQPELARLQLPLVPEHRDALASATEECLWRSGEPPAQSLRLQGADGSQRPVELSLRRVQLGSPGRPDGAVAMLVTCQDLSDIQHVQTMLQGMSSLLRQIVDGAPVASFVIDRHHRVTHWNTARTRLTGHGADAMIGSTEPWRAFYAEARPLLADLIVDGVDSAELPHLHGDSARASDLVARAREAEGFFPQLEPGGRWLNFTAAPLRDHDDQVIGAIVTLQDVSQAHRTEEELTRRLDRMVESRSAELAANARLMDAFIDNAPIGVVYTVKG